MSHGMQLQLTRPAPAPNEDLDLEWENKKWIFHQINSKYFKAKLTNFSCTFYINLILFNA